MLPSAHMQAGGERGRQVGDSEISGGTVVSPVLRAPNTHAHTMHHTCDLYKNMLILRLHAYFRDKDTEAQRNYEA